MGRGRWGTWLHPVLPVIISEKAQLARSGEGTGKELIEPMQHPCQWTWPLDGHPQ